MAPSTVRGLALPARLASLIDQDLWRHPGDAALAEAVPWFEDALAFVRNPEQMMYASRSLDLFADDPQPPTSPWHADGMRPPRSNCRGSTLIRPC